MKIPHSKIINSAELSKGNLVTVYTPREEVDARYDDYPEESFGLFGMLGGQQKPKYDGVPFLVEVIELPYVVLRCKAGKNGVFHLDTRDYMFIEIGEEYVKALAPDLIPYKDDIKSNA